MYSRECSYCENMFNCAGKANDKSCIGFSLEPSRAEMYREWIKEKTNGERSVKK